MTNPGILSFATSWGYDWESSATALKGFDAMDLDHLDYHAEKILVVDDDELIGQNLEHLLNQHGFRALYINNATDALNAFKKDRTYSFLITDIIMPEMDGIELMHRVKNEDPDLGIIAMTAHSDRYSYMDVLEAGATDFIRKPFSPEELEAKIKRCIIERESKKRYRSLISNIPVGLFRNTTGADSKLIMANPALAKMLGYDSVDELLTVQVSGLYADGDEWISFSDKLLSQGKLESEEIQLKKKDGTRIWGTATVRVVRDDSGNIVCFDGQIEDISKRKQAELETAKLEARLHRSQKMEAIGTLAGGVAHDLNNVLSGIVGYPDLFLLQLPEDSPLRNGIMTIRESGKKAAAIVEDLLTLARRGVAKYEALDLNRVISSYLKSPEYQKLLSFHPGIRVKTRFEEGLLSILGSPVHLSKTIMNLVSNAAEAMPDGGTISISTENRILQSTTKGYDAVEKGHYVILTVSDSGIGISSKDLESIFEPFYTKKVMGRSGTGLGMAVVWGTVKDHNGYIDVQSTEDEGTTFKLYFPMTQQKPEKHRERLQLEDHMGKGESVLVVDDVEQQRRIASGMLETLGYSVTTLSSGEEAVEYMKHHSVDLLVLDMIMDPGIDGLETYKRISRLHPDQRAIIASGFSETKSVKEVQKLGAGQYIKKPYSLLEISSVVRNELDR